MAYTHPQSWGVTIRLMPANATTIVVLFRKRNSGDGQQASRVIGFCLPVAPAYLSVDYCIVSCKLLDTIPTAWLGCSVVALLDTCG